MGVGNGDFTQMDQLDADEEPLVSSIDGAVMDRDIVQVHQKVEQKLQKIRPKGV